MFCGKCGTENDEGTIFCSNCGKSPNDVKKSTYKPETANFPLINLSGKYFNRIFEILLWIFLLIGIIASAIFGGMFILRAPVLGVFLGLVVGGGISFFLIICIAGIVSKFLRLCADIEEIKGLKKE